MRDDANGERESTAERNEGATEPSEVRGRSAGDEPMRGSDPLHSTEHGLSDLLNVRSGGRFTSSEVSGIVAFASFGLALAWWLASTSTLFDAALPADVIGLLAERNEAKGFETRLFLFTVFLLPGFAWAAARFLRAGTSTASSIRTSGWWHVAAGATLATLAHWAAQSARLPTIGLASIALATATGPVGALLGAALARRSSRRRTTVPAPAEDARSWRNAVNGPIADLVVCAACVAVAWLSVGPRTLPDASLATSIVRIAAVFVGSATTLIGVCFVLAPRRGLGALVLARPFALLAAVRFLNGDEAITATWILGGIATAAAIAWAWRTRSEDDGAHASAPPVRSPFAWNVAAPWLVLVLVSHFGVHGGIDLFHSGEWLTLGAMTRDGLVPFRDLYLQHGLVQNALRSAWTMEWIGDSLWADRATLNVLYAVTHAAFLWMLLPILRSPYVALVVALGFATRGLYLQPRFIPMFLAVACLLRAIEAAHGDESAPSRRRVRRHLSIAGIAAGVGVFWSLDIGIYTSLAAAAYFALDAWFRRGRVPLVRSFVSQLSPFAIGACIGAAPFVAYLASHGALRAFVDNSVQQVALQLPVWGLPFPSFSEWLASASGADLKAFLGDGTFIAFVAPLVFVGTLAYLVVRSMSAPLAVRDAQRLLIAIVGLVVYRTALGRSDAGHFAYAAALLWPLALMIAEDALRACSLRPALLRLAPACLVVGFLFTAFEPAYALVRQWSRISEVEPDLPGGGFSYAPPRRMRDVLVPDTQAQVLTALKAWLDERLPPGEPFVDFCNAGAAYYFVERPIATRYAYAAYAATPDMQREFIAALERTKPRYLLASHVIGALHVDGVPLDRRLPLLAAYFKANYEPCAEEVFGTMLRRTSR